MADSPQTGAPLTILVADDEDLIVRAVRRVFERRGHTIHAASNAQSALALLEAHAFDAVLVDQNMPGSGLVVLDRLLTRDGGFAGLAILMTGGMDDGEVAALPGSVTRLQKPFRFAEVVPLVENHFNS